jgi:hypothetical protein
VRSECWSRHEPLHHLCPRGVGQSACPPPTPPTEIADRGYVLQAGQIVLADTTQTLFKNH